MVQNLVDNLSSWLLTQNSSWLTQIRTLGYLNRANEGNMVVNDELQEIGLTDTRDNSAYIRYRNDIGFNAVEIPSIASYRCFKYDIPLRIVVLLKTENVNEVNILMARLINSYSVLATGQAKNIKCMAYSGGSNTLSIYKNETGKEDTENAFRVFYCDFNLIFDDYSNCDQINEIPSLMPCNCENILELPCVALCDMIDIGVDATTTGEATVLTEFNGSSIRFSIDVVTGDPIQVPAELLNSDYTFNLQILEGEEVVTRTEGETIYNCFQVQIKP